MTDEKLIKEAAITIREADGALSHGDAILYAEAAFAVFEKAHAPTSDEAWIAGERSIADAAHYAANPDDEREALMQAVRAGRQARQSWWTNTEAPAEAPSDDEFIVEALASAGFRRSEVSEPQANVSNPENTCTPGEQMSVPEPQVEPTPINGKWVCGKCAREVSLGHDDGQIPEHHRTCPKRAQGEPSDAQVDAACAEIAARMNYKVQPTRGTMRAALRAAGEVKR